MTSFIAIYRGQTIGDAKLIAVSADASVVAEVSSRLLKNALDNEDKVTSCLEQGRRSALRLIYKETKAHRKVTKNLSKG